GEVIGTQRKDRKQKERDLLSGRNADPGGRWIYSSPVRIRIAEHCAQLLADELPGSLHQGRDREKRRGQVKIIDPQVKRTIAQLQASAVSHGGAENVAFRGGRFFQALMGDAGARKWCDKNGIELRAVGGGSNVTGGALVPDDIAEPIFALRDLRGVFR